VSASGRFEKPERRIDMEYKWMHIKGYEDRYRVTVFGEVFSLRKKQFLTPQVTNSGYEVVHLYGGGKRARKIALVHRLVASAFLPNAERFPEINHKDGNKTDNRADNLEWCTRKINVKHALSTGLVDPSKWSISVIGTSLADRSKVRYSSQKAAEIALSGTGKQSSAIHHCFVGKKKSAYGYTWESAA
jgi:hypothetical protein